MIPRHNDNIPGQISEAIFPGRKVRRLTINLEVGALATVEAEIYCGDELRTVLGVIGDCPVPDNAPNLDAAPAARAPEPEPEPAARRRPAGGTGGTDHGASPEARASVGRPRTDNADLPTCAGTGDTQEPVAWGVDGLGGILATSTSRTDAVDIQSEYAFVTEVVPLYRQAPNFAPPPPDNAAKAPDNAEPEAWAVCTPGDGDWSPCYFHEPHAQRCASAIFGSKNIVPLYRKPTLTDAEAETLRELRDEAAQYADEIGLCASEVRGRQRIIAGLLERLGGGR